MVEIRLKTLDHLGKICCIKIVKLARYLGIYIFVPEELNDFVNINEAFGVERETFELLNPGLPVLSFPYLA